MARTKRVVETAETLRLTVGPNDIYIGVLYHSISISQDRWGGRGFNGSPEHKGPRKSAGAMGGPDVNLGDVVAPVAELQLPGTCAGEEELPTSRFRVAHKATS